MAAAIGDSRAASALHADCILASTRAHLSALLPIDRVNSTQHDFSGLDDTRSEPALAFALDCIITELDLATASRRS